MSLCNHVFSINLSAGGSWYDSLKECHPQFCDHEDRWEQGWKEAGLHCRDGQMLQQHHTALKIIFKKIRFEDESRWQNTITFLHISSASNICQRHILHINRRNHSRLANGDRRANRPRSREKGPWDSQSGGGFLWGQGYPALHCPEWPSEGRKGKRNIWSHQSLSTVPPSDSTASTQAFFDAAQESMFQPCLPAHPPEPPPSFDASKILISFSSLNTGLAFNGMNLLTGPGCIECPSSAPRGLSILSFGRWHLVYLSTPTQEQWPINCGHLLRLLRLQECWRIEGWFLHTFPSFLFSLTDSVLHVTQWENKNSTQGISFSNQLLHCSATTKTSLLTWNKLTARYFSSRDGFMQIRRQLQFRDLNPGEPHGSPCPAPEGESFGRGERRLGGLL